MSDCDPVLRTARRLLDGQVCECGDLLLEHVMGVVTGEVVDGDELTVDTCDQCNCRKFRPVEFTVTRAPGPRLAPGTLDPRD